MTSAQILASIEKNCPKGKTPVIAWKEEYLTGFTWAHLHNLEEVPHFFLGFEYVDEFLEHEDIIKHLRSVQHTWARNYC